MLIPVRVEQRLVPSSPCITNLCAQKDVQVWIEIIFENKAPGWSFFVKYKKKKNLQPQKTAVLCWALGSSKHDFAMAQWALILSFHTAGKIL